MTDFDDLCERLVLDRGFAADLAADPAAALAGYHLTDDERRLLYSQVNQDAGGSHQVEDRTSKASLFGLLGPLAEAVGLTHGSGVGHAAGAAAARAVEAAHHPVHQGFGPAVHQGFGPADPNGTDVSGIVTDPTTGSGGGGGPLGTGLTALPGQDGTGGPPPAGYHVRVDVDGDGRWDQYTAHGRNDGGVDVVADMNHDGRPDFVGHDDNHDGIIDRADYDKDFDGRFETHMRDIDGDGWMDTTTVDPR